MIKQLAAGVEDKEYNTLVNFLSIIIKNARAKRMEQ